MLADLIRKAERDQTGLSDPFEDHRKRPLAEHLSDFEADLRARGVTVKQIKLKLTRIRRLLETCSFSVIADLSASRVQAFLADLRAQGKPLPPLQPGKLEYTRDELAAALGVKPESIYTLIKRHRLQAEGISKYRRYPLATAAYLHQQLSRGKSIQTVNYYLREIKSFCRWLVRHRRMPENPLAFLEAGNTKLDPRHFRRALFPDELTAILQSALASPTVFRGLSGEDRHFLYLTAMTSGFRAGELARLTPESFDLGASTPVITLGAIHTKNRKPVTQPLPKETSQALRGYLAGKPMNIPVWAGTWFKRAAEMLRIDLEAAGISYVDEGPDGLLYADFHSLRHSFLTLLARSGVHPKLSQALARHSTITLTLDRYSHVQLLDEAAALEALPKILPKDADEAPSSRLIAG
jgi:integrase